MPRHHAFSWSTSRRPGLYHRSPRLGECTPPLCDFSFGAILGAMAAPPRRKTLISKLIGAYLVLTLGLLGAFAFSAHYLGKRSLDDALGQRLVSIAQATAAQVLPEVFAQIAPGDEQGRAYGRLRR